MSVTLNQAGLARLLESRESPVAALILEKAERVLEEARHNVDDIMAASVIPASQDVDLEQREDLSVIVGIRDSGSIARYLASKETREHRWLTPAIREVFGA